jgi:hypothetical protein
MDRLEDELNRLNSNEMYYFEHSDRLLRTNALPFIGMVGMLVDGVNASLRSSLDEYNFDNQTRQANVVPAELNEIRNSVGRLTRFVTDSREFHTSILDQYGLGRARQFLRRNGSYAATALERMAVTRSEHFGKASSFIIEDLPGLIHLLSAENRRMLPHISLDYRSVSDVADSVNRREERAYSGEEFEEEEDMDF